MSRRIRREVLHGFKVNPGAPRGRFAAWPCGAGGGEAYGGSAARAAAKGGGAGGGQTVNVNVYQWATLVDAEQAAASQRGMSQRDVVKTAKAVIGKEFRPGGDGRKHLGRG